MSVCPYPQLYRALKDFMETDIYSLSQEEIMHEVGIFESEVEPVLAKRKALFKDQYWELEKERAALEVAIDEDLE